MCLCWYKQSITHKHRKHLKPGANSVLHKAENFIMSVKPGEARLQTADDLRQNCNNNPEVNPATLQLPNAPLVQMMDSLHGAKTSHYSTTCTHLVCEPAEDSSLLGPADKY